MNTLYRDIIASAPVSTRLQFGHNFNVIVSAIDTTVRLEKGLPKKNNTYVTFQAIDPETKKVKAQSELSFWNLDHEQDLVYTHMLGQMTALASILEAVGISSADYETAVFTAIGVTDPETELVGLIKTKAGAASVQDALQNSFATLMAPVLGENCPLLACKLTTNKKGFIEFPNYMGWIVPMTDKDNLPEVTPLDIKRHEEALKADKTTKKAAPDQLGSAKTPAAEKPAGSTSGFMGL